MIFNNMRLNGLTKFIIILLIFAIMLGSLVLAVSFSVSISRRSGIVTVEKAVSMERFDYIIILGAGLSADGTPSSMLADRIDTGIELYEAGVADKILMSGDRSENYDEVGAMKRYAQAKGVPEDVIVLDPNGYSTYDSITRAASEFKIKKAVVVTQEYHLTRALYISERVGIDAVGVSADKRPYIGQAWRNLREHFARFKDFIMTLPKSEYK